MRKRNWWALFALLMIGVLPRMTDADTVSAIDPAFTAAGRWFEADMRGAGTASIETLSGAETVGAPLPVGAAELTTGFANGDKAEIAVADSFGAMGDIIGSLSLGYSYFKETVAGGNIYAAPSLKLAFYNAAYAATGADGYVVLVYEPTWNQAGFEGSSRAAPADVWTTVAIDADHGLFWGTGGFGLPNTAGGPPLRTLGGWLSASLPEFGAAELLSIGMGVGTYNQGQVGYFDDVRISTAAYSRRYDFEPAGANAVPVPAAAWMGLLLLGGLGLARRVRGRP